MSAYCLTSSTHTGIHVPCCAHVGTCVAPLGNQEHDIVRGIKVQTFALKTDELSVMLLFKKSGNEIVRASQDQPAQPDGMPQRCPAKTNETRKSCFLTNDTQVICVF